MVSINGHDTHHDRKTGLPFIACEGNDWTTGFIVSINGHDTHHDRKSGLPFIACEGNDWTTGFENEWCGTLCSVASVNRKYYLNIGANFYNSKHLIEINNFMIK